MTGRKDDAEKPRYDLIPFESLHEIVRVLTFGVRKYEADNWKLVEGARGRYLAACLRHLTSWAQGEKNDPETGINHLAHAGCCILFLLWFDLKGGDNAQK